LEIRNRDKQNTDLCQIQISDFSKPINYLQGESYKKFGESSKDREKFNKIESKK